MEESLSVDVTYTSSSPTMIAYGIYLCNLLFLYFFVRSLSINSEKMTNGRSFGEFILDVYETGCSFLLAKKENFALVCAKCKNSRTNRFFLLRAKYSHIRTLSYQYCGAIIWNSVCGLAGFVYHFLLMFFGREEKVGLMKNIDDSLPGHSVARPATVACKLPPTPTVSINDKKETVDIDSSASPVASNTIYPDVSPDAISTPFLSDSCAKVLFTPLKSPAQLVNLPKKKPLFAFGFNNRKRSYNTEDTDSVTTGGSFRINNAAVDALLAEDDNLQNGFATPSRNSSVNNIDSECRSTRSSHRLAKVVGGRQASCTAGGNCLVM